MNALNPWRRRSRPTPVRCLRVSLIVLIIITGFGLGVEMVNLSDAGLWSHEGLPTMSHQLNSWIHLPMPRYSALDFGPETSTRLIALTSAVVVVVAAGIAVKLLEVSQPRTSTSLEHRPAGWTAVAVCIGALVTIILTPPLAEPIPEQSVAVTIPKRDLDQWKGSRIGSSPTILVSSPPNLVREASNVDSAAVFLFWDVTPANRRHPRFSLWIPGGQADFPEDAARSWDPGRSCRAISHRVLGDRKTWSGRFTKVTCEINAESRRRTAQSVSELTTGAIYRQGVLLKIGSARDLSYLYDGSRSSTASSISGPTLIRSTAISAVPAGLDMSNLGELSLGEVPTKKLDLSYSDSPSLYSSDSMHIPVLALDRTRQDESPRFPAMAVAFTLRSDQQADLTLSQGNPLMFGRLVYFDALEARGTPFVARIKIENLGAAQRRDLITLIGSAVVGGAIYVRLLSRRSSKRA